LNMMRRRDAMQADHIRLLYDYHDWANDCLVRHVEALSEEALNAPLSNGIGSIRVTLVHVLGGENLWRNRWEGRSRSSVLNPDEFPTLAVLKDRWQFEHERLRAFLSTLRDEDLTQVIAYTDTGAAFLSPALAAGDPPAQSRSPASERDCHAPERTRTFAR
jgi:uncharacterized damage-inducible protein DinB